MAGSARSRASTSSWFVKTVRSGARYSDGSLPPEVWQAGGVCPTLNTGDNTGEARATVVIATPLAVRGRPGGSDLEFGEVGGPYNTLRAGDGGSSGSALVAVETVTGADVTHTLTANGSDGSEDGTGRGTPTVGVTPVDLRNAAREGGTGVGTPGLGLGEPEEPSYTLTAATRAVPGVAAATTVRRLTPLECERLQGFPDGHTDVPGATDSPRYKQCGNAVTVNVFDWVIGRIVAVDSRAPE